MQERERFFLIFFSFCHVLGSKSYILIYKCGAPMGDGAPQGLHPTMPTRPIACGAGFGGVMGLVLGWIWGGFGVDRMGMVYARM